MIDVTIIIATSGRPDPLQQTLMSLCTVQVPDDLSAEVLVVENGQCSETKEWLRQLPQTRLSFRYLFDPVALKSRALNLGIAEASGNVLLFTDDDVRFPANWLIEMCTPLLHGEGDVVVGGCRIAPHLLRAWMTRDHRCLLASTEYLLDDNPSEFAGVNMACHRKVFSKVPSFDLELGGGGLGNFEDCLFAYQLRKAGYTFVSRTNVHVEHHPAASRFLYKAWLQASLRYGRSIAYVLHHFRHERIRFVRARALYFRSKLLLRTLFSSRRSPNAEGILPWELSYRIDINKLEHYLHERQRPRNYDKLGLVKHHGTKDDHQEGKAL